MKNILIIGCGYLGSHLANYFAQKDWQVDIAGKQSFYVKHLSPNVSFHEMDTNKIDNIASLIQKDHIVLYAAGSINATNTFDDVQQDIEETYLPFVSLLNHCAEKNVGKFVFLSSAGTVYGDSEDKASEDDCLNPINIYGLQKVYFENLIKIKEYETNKLPFLILRVSNPYGGIQNPRKNQGIIPVLINKALNKEEFLFWGNTEAIRDFIYIDDFLAATYLSIENSTNEVLNISSGTFTSIATIIQTIEETMNTSIDLIQKSSTNKIVMINKVDNRKLIQLTGYHPTVSIQQGIKNMVDKARI